MKIPKTSIAKICILLIASISFSCGKSFLDVKDVSGVFKQSYVKDLSTMNDFLNGLYVINAVNINYGYAAAYPELIADNLKPVSATTANLQPHYKWMQLADNIDKQELVGVHPQATAMNPLWQLGYRGIRGCNFVIEDIGKYRPENNARANYIEGQALALRAAFHFILVNTFAQQFGYTVNGQHPGIPYITFSDVTKSYSRESVAEVYRHIVEDLNRAIELMPTGAYDSRLMNKLAAKALLARVFLFMEDYPNAKKIALEVTKDVPLLSIADGYPDAIFKYSNTKSNESLFQITPTGSPALSTTFLGVRLSGTSKRFVSTNDLANLLTEDGADVRSKWVRETSGIWEVGKFPQNSAPEVVPEITVPSNAYYPAFIRSTEMFLTVAESAAKLGEEALARQYLNLIRKRSNPAIEDTDASGQSLMQLIQRERRKELCFEGLRMFDLQRWKLDIVRSDAVFSESKTLLYPSDKAIAPIPVSDVTLMGISQNKGY